MTPRLFARMVVLAGLVCTSAIVIAGAIRLRPHSRTAAHLRADAMRVQQHLRRVENELRARDVSGLSAEQRAARARNIGNLHAYLTAGIFPHNHDRPRERLPFFRDEHGTLCAVGYLMQQSGRADLVGRIARTDNNVHVRELASDAEVGEWLTNNGLSLEEAARIQPQYGGDDEAVSGADLVGTLLLTAADITAIGLSLSGKTKNTFAPGIFAMSAGALTFVFGLSSIDDNGQSLAPLHLSLGAATFLVGAVKTVVVAKHRAKQHGVPAESQERRLQNWSPIVNTNLGGRMQLGVTRRF
jgi:hypothetical protein